MFKYINRENESLLNEIEDAQKEKARILINMGLILNKKINENEVQVNLSEFEDMNLEILNLDKIIYENNKKLSKIEQINNGIVCECGHHIKDESKFCSQCGKMIEFNENNIICPSCEEEIDEDSLYCVCCGKKLV
jgi:NADH pyrophosphatase NudC (nudix superfamily)